MFRYLAIVNLRGNRPDVQRTKDAKARAVLPTKDTVEGMMTRPWSSQVVFTAACTIWARNEILTGLADRMVSMKVVFTEPFL